MENSSSKLTSSGETHTTALTFMVLFTALVLVVALGGVSSDGQTSANQPASDVSTSTTANSHTNTTNPPTEIDIPAGIPVDEEAVVENRMISRGADEPMQQVITFDSSLSAGDLVTQYQTWLAENDYTIEEERVSQKAASLAATNGDNALIVLISYLSNSGTSRVEIINYRR